MLLKVKDIETYYGNFQALRRISLAIEEGEIVCLLGANGSGKTTLLKTISGIVTPKTGSIEFMNKRIDNLRPNLIVKLGISQSPEGRKLFTDMSVAKNLMLGALVRQGDKAGVNKSLEEVVALFPILKEREKQKAGSLSGGEQQMLAIARAMMSRPKLLMLDEPSLGLAPMIVEKVFEALQRINEMGTTIFIAEQNAVSALNIANRGYVMQTGEIVLHGTSKNLRENEAVKQSYLGR